MADLKNEDRNEKIRNQWLERIGQNELNIAKKLSEPNLSFDKFLEFEKIQKKEQELKKRIVDGYTPDEPPETGWGWIEGNFMPLTEEKTELKEIDRLFFDTQDLKDEEKSQLNSEIHGNGEVTNKLIGRICSFFSRK